MKAILAILSMAALPAAAAPLACLIEPSEVVEVGSSVIGVLDRVQVDRGAVVRRGQPLAYIRSDVERAALSMTEVRAHAEAELKAAESNHEFARRNHVRATELKQKNFISAQALEQSETELKLAAQKIAQAREQQRLTQEELTLARAQVAQRVIKSPIDGVVVERYLNAGERIEERPIVRLAKLDPLRVEVIVPAAHFKHVRPGMVATVRPELPDTAGLEAKIVLVDKVVDTASNTFRVRLELPNPDNKLPAGVRCKADLDLPSAIATPESGAARFKPVSVTSNPARSK